MFKLTEKERNEIIHSINNNKVSQRDLAKQFGVSKTTIQKIHKKNIVKLTNLRLLDNRIETGVLKIFNNFRVNKIPVNGTLLCEAARLLANKYAIQNFSASRGWLDKFKKRNHLSFKAISGESGSANFEEADKFKSDFETKVEGYEKKDIFNMDESALFWKSLPRKSFVDLKDDCKGLKIQKHRITIVLCCSFLGEKLEPFFIGKSKKPRCFKRISSSFKIYYRANTKGWMTRTLFKEWIEILNGNFINEGRKIVMLLDNATSHFNIDLSNIKFIFLPPNTTSLIQPLDQGIIKVFKDHYRRYFMTRLLDKETNLFKTIKETDLVDVFFWSKMAWKDVTKSTIENCFKKSFEPKQNAKETMLLTSIVDEITKNKKGENEEIPDLSEEEERILVDDDVEKDAIFDIFRDLKRYCMKYKASSLENILKLEREVIQNESSGSIKKYFELSKR